MTDTESSEDEKLKLLKESIDRDLISDDLYKNSAQEAVKKSSEPTSSLRLSITEDKSDFNPFNLPPGAQKYIAKELDKYLEHSIAEKLVEPAENLVKKKRKRQKNKVRLFRDSKHFLDIASEDNLIINNKRPNAKLEFDSSDEEKVKSVLVTTEEILSKKEVLNWKVSTRNKKIYRYKPSKKGKVLLEIDNK